MFVAYQCFNLIFRGVAQLGRALRSGRRGRKFKSCHLDHKKEIPNERYLFFYLLVYTRLELAAGFSQIAAKKFFALFPTLSGAFARKPPALRRSYPHCFRSLRKRLWDGMWSQKRSLSKNCSGSVRLMFV